MAVNSQNNVITPGVHFTTDPNTGAQAAIRAQGAQAVTNDGASVTLNITSATVVKVGAGRTARVSVNIAGSSSGTLNDCATTGAAAIANQIMAIPNAVGIYYIDWPHSTGIVVVPGTGQNVSINYE